MLGADRPAGGGGGIRTPGTLSGTAVFKTAAFNRSATPPREKVYAGTDGRRGAVGIHPRGWPKTSLTPPPRAATLSRGEREGKGRKMAERPRSGRRRQPAGNMESRFRGNDSSKKRRSRGAARRGGRRVREAGRRGRRTGRRTSSRPLPRAPIERSGELPARCRLHERLRRGQARARRDEVRPRRPEAYCGQYVAGRRGGHSPGRLDG